jgi:hypothetical protein
MGVGGVWWWVSWQGALWGGGGGAAAAGAPRAPPPPPPQTHTHTQTPPPPRARDNRLGLRRERRHGERNGAG